LNFSSLIHMLLLCNTLSTLAVVVASAVTHHPSRYPHTPVVSPCRSVALPSSMYYSLPHPYEPPMNSMYPYQYDCYPPAYLTHPSSIYDPRLEPLSCPLCVAVAAGLTDGLFTEYWVSSRPTQTLLLPLDEPPLMDRLIATQGEHPYTRTKLGGKNSLGCSK